MVCNVILQEQQVRQEQEIGALERQLEEAVFRHENHVRKMKTQFLQERRAYDAEMAARVRAMTQRASKVTIVKYMTSCSYMAQTVLYVWAPIKLMQLCLSHQLLCIYLQCTCRCKQRSIRYVTYIPAHTHTCTHYVHMHTLLQHMTLYGSMFYAYALCYIPSSSHFFPSSFLPPACLLHLSSPLISLYTMSCVYLSASLRVSGRAYSQDPVREPATASGAEATHWNHQWPSAAKEEADSTV